MQTSDKCIMRRSYHPSWLAPRVPTHGWLPVYTHGMSDALALKRAPLVLSPHSVHTLAQLTPRPPT